MPGLHRQISCESHPFQRISRPKIFDLLEKERSCPSGHSGFYCASCRHTSAGPPIVLEELSAALLHRPTVSHLAIRPRELSAHARGQRIGLLPGLRMIIAATSPAALFSNLDLGSSHTNEELRVGRGKERYIGVPIELQHQTAALDCDLRG